MDIASDRFNVIKEIAKQPKYNNNNNKYLFMTPLIFTKDEMLKNLADDDENEFIIEIDINEELEKIEDCSRNHLKYSCL